VSKSVEIPNLLVYCKIFQLRFTVKKIWHIWFDLTRRNVRFVRVGYRPTLQEVRQRSTQRTQDVIISNGYIMRS